AWRLGPAPHAEPAQPTARVPGHTNGQGVVSVEHAQAPTRHAFDHHRLDAGEIFERLDPLKSQMVGLNIQHATDVAPVEGETFAKDAPAGALHHSRIDSRVAPHHARASRYAGVSLPDPFAPYVDPAGVGEARSQALDRQ